MNWNLNHLHHVIGNETVVFYDGIFVDHLFAALETTPKRTVANYLAWRIVSMTAAFLSDELRQRNDQFQATKYGVRKINPRSVQCAKQTMKLCVESIFSSDKNLFQIFKFMMAYFFLVYQLPLEPCMFVDSSMKNHEKWPKVLQRKFTKSLLKR